MNSPPINITIRQLKAKLLSIAARILAGMPDRCSINSPTLANVSKILIIQWSRIGDTVLITPFLRDLRLSFPDTFIELVVDDSCSNLLEHCPFINKVTSLPRQDRSLWALLKCRELASRHLSTYDLCIIPRWDTDWWGAAFLAVMSKASTRVGFSSDCSEAKRVFNAGFDSLFTNVLVNKQICHEAQRGLQLLSWMGYPTGNTQLELWLTEEDLATARKTLQHSGMPSSDYVCIGFAASEQRRIWPEERYAELSNLLYEKHDLKSVLVGGPDDKPQAMRIAGSIRHDCAVVCGALTLRQSAAVLKGARLFVGNNSGPMHIAAAAGIAICEISPHMRDAPDSSAESDARFGPLTKATKTVCPERGIRPCTSECLSKKSHCVSSITVEAVLEACRILLGAEPI